MSTEQIRYTINRSVIFLIPKQPMLNWVIAADPGPPLSITLEELQSEVDGFLVSQEKIETTEDAQRWVYRRWEMFFDRFLEEWYTDETLWPKKRTLKMFKEWFDVRYHAMLWDMIDEPIAHEDWARDDDMA
jgi:hypothetical protein